MDQEIKSAGDEDSIHTHAVDHFSKIHCNPDLIRGSSNADGRCFQHGLQNHTNTHHTQRSLQDLFAKLGNS